MQVETDTTGFAGGLNTSHTPGARISAPLTTSEMPMKNQMEIPLSCMIVTNPRYQNIMLSTTKTTADHHRPERRPVIERYLCFVTESSVTPYTRPVSSLSGFGLVT